MRRRKPTSEEIIEKYKGGLSMKAIATRWGIPLTEVRGTLKSANVPIRYLPGELQARVARVLAESGDDIVRLYQEGESSRALSSTFGISSHSILRFLDKRGVKRTPEEVHALVSKRM